VYAGQRAATAPDSNGFTGESVVICDLPPVPRVTDLVRQQTRPDNSASMITIAMIDNPAKRLTAETTPTWRYG
jgi:hypothetical protein